MKHCKLSLAQVLVAAISITLYSSVVFAASEEQGGKSGLNGKWEGRPPLGGELTMTLTVDKDNQIQGSGVIPGGGVKASHAQVTGTVNGNRVTLETFFPSARPQSRIHYACTLAGDALQCRTKSGYKTTFKKVD